jgi:S-adenosylmethionine hydrolase
VRKIFLLVLFVFSMSYGFADVAPSIAHPKPSPSASITSVPGQKPNGLIILLTDYGDQDFYVGALKGKIYSIFPNARIDAITNQVPPFSIREGAYLLAMSAPEFPPGTVFCVAVDPGEEVPSKTVIVETEDGKYYVAPDNGVLTLVLNQFKVVEARIVANPDFMKKWASGATGFQGIDVLGPTAAWVAEGMPLEKIGPPVGNLVRFKVALPQSKKREVDGEVEHVDWFGNIHTNIPAALLEKLGVSEKRTLRLEIGSETVVAPYVKTYSEVGEGNWLVLINDLGNLEIARNQASANALLQVSPGTHVRVHF